MLAGLTARLTFALYRRQLDGFANPHLKRRPLAADGALEKIYGCADNTNREYRHTGLFDDESQTGTPPAHGRDTCAAALGGNQKRITRLQDTHNPVQGLAVIFAAMNGDAAKQAHQYVLPKPGPLPDIRRAQNFDVFGPKGEQEGRIEGRNMVEGSDISRPARDISSPSTSMRANRWNRPRKTGRSKVRAMRLKNGVW